MIKSKSAVFLDINTFASEEFTSGLLITVREILERLNNKGIITSILSVAHGPRSKYWSKEHKLGKTERKVQGTTVKEILLDDPLEKDMEPYIESIKELLHETSPGLILMNTPAVFLDEINILSLKEAINFGSKVVVLLVDELFPTLKAHPKDKVKRYYSLLKQTDVVVNSKRINEVFYKETGIEGQLFPNLFTYENIISSEGLHEYITLINHHPIKGREIFDAVAQKMPNKRFLIVENWPDVPQYVPPSKNITFSKFIKNVPELYNKIRILLVPSLCQEGPARVVMEALLNGIPVIAHNIGSISEIGDRYIYYVNPPSEITPKLEGTIIYPKISKPELERVSNDFTKIIEEIDKSPAVWRRNSLGAQKYALKYCEESEKDFLPFIERWFA